MTTPSLNPSGDKPQLASVSALAVLMGVDKAAVSRRVSKLEAQGLLATQCDGPGKAKLIDVAAYLAATAQTVDAVRALNGAQARPQATAPAPAPAEGTLAQSQALRAAIRAEREQLDLDKAKGLLVPVEQVRDAMAHAAGELVRGLETLPGRAAELAATVGREGEPGARAALKDFVRELRERLAADMTLAAAERAEDDDE